MGVLRSNEAVKLLRGSSARLLPTAFPRRGPPKRERKAGRDSNERGPGPRAARARWKRARARSTESARSERTHLLGWHAHFRRRREQRKRVPETARLASARHSGCGIADARTAVEVRRYGADAARRGASVTRSHGGAQQRALTRERPSRHWTCRRHLSPSTDSAAAARLNPSPVFTWYGAPRNTGLRVENAILAKQKSTIFLWLVGICGFIVEKSSRTITLCVTPKCRFQRGVIFLLNGDFIYPFFVTISILRNSVILIHLFRFKKRGLFLFYTVIIIVTENIYLILYKVYFWFLFQFLIAWCRILLY